MPQPGGSRAAAGPTRPSRTGRSRVSACCVMWIPIRVVIWAVREDGRGLFSGDRAALAPGQLFGALVIAAALAMLGALLAARIEQRRVAPSSR